MIIKRDGVNMPSAVAEAKAASMDNAVYVWRLNTSSRLHCGSSLFSECGLLSNTERIGWAVLGFICRSHEGGRWRHPDRTALKREKLSAWSCAHINGHLSRMCHVSGEKMLVSLEPLSGGGIDTNCGKACAIASNSRRYGDG